MSKRALLSVSDKTGIEAFARALVELGYEILSTDGTRHVLAAAGIPCTSVEEITGFPECFGGRVKSMHPKIMGGILFRRDNSEDQAEVKRYGIEPIDIVVVNLYPFEKALRKKIQHGATRTSDDPELMELIDIGGPTLLRSAAKNCEHVTVICDPSNYARVIAELKKNGTTSIELRRELAGKVFTRTAAYDSAIAGGLTDGSDGAVMLTSGLRLRYGENPHQWGIYYDVAGHPRSWHILQEEKQMSYLNILDADGAIRLVSEFDAPAAACIKHANPSGVACDDDIDQAFQRAYDADRLSAFGVIIALNRTCTKGVVEKIIAQNVFVEVLVAPSYETDALELLRKRPKIRVIESAYPQPTDDMTYRSAMGGILAQSSDTKRLRRDELQCVTDTAPTDEQIDDMLFAWTVVKHAKSNAVVFVKDKATVGIGCGQTSRVDSVWIAAKRAGELSEGAVMASDAFFPFPDSIEEAAKHGISAIIQPGGSIRDNEVIEKANELRIPMVVTGVRAFRH